MSKHLGPIEVVCDCPPYSIVQACHMVGLKRPEDVRWCRLSQFLTENTDNGNVLGIFSWHMLVNRSLKGSKCSCGEQLPRMHRCLFSTSSGTTFTYLLGQCSRCETIFWDDADDPV